MVDGIQKRAVIVHRSETAEDLADPLEAERILRKPHRAMPLHSRGIPIHVQRGTGMSEVVAGKRPTLRSCIAYLDPAASRVRWTEASPLVSPLRLRLEQPDGGVAEVSSSNYYLDDEGYARRGFERIVDVALGRDPAKQALINERLTEAHSRFEMSFMKKHPVTGNYDQPFSVAVHGSVVPVKEAHFNKLVESTAPVMCALRDLLQRVYSVPNATAADLGIDHLPEVDQQWMMEAIKGSIYFEPYMVSPEMRNYPFLAVGGFDAALGDLDKADPVFFEFNLGTPSGISNNVQLLDILRTEDPELFATLKDRLPKDDTFAILRDTIESNALSWTKNPNGISVVMGPGPSNGAHPDVASIALYTGMPLVTSSDLYIDVDRNVRLNTGKLGDDPVVTGIYGRKEESYFLQSNELGIPLRDPHELDNKRFGKDLEPGVRYLYKFTASGKRKRVQRDAERRPVIEAIIGESIGVDPLRPNTPPGNFADAVKSGKLYYSGFGGRVVDDKRVFQSISQHLAPAYVRRAVGGSGSGGAEDAPLIARPPRTLQLDEYPSFYESTSPEDYVVKEPDKSGGDGVKLMANLSNKQRREVIEDVKRNPGRYIVQEFTDMGMISSPEEDESGAMRHGTLATDLRIFVMMDANGNVRAGPNSLLLRTAGRFKASTNTSQGGGYGICAILKDEGQAQVRGRSLGRSVLPTVPQTPYLSARRRESLLGCLENLNECARSSEPEPRDRPPKLDFRKMAFMQRESMDLLGREFTPIMTLLRDHDEGKLRADPFRRQLLGFRTKLMKQDRFPVLGLESDVRAVLSRYRPPAPKSKTATAQARVRSSDSAHAPTSAKAPA